MISRMSVGERRLGTPPRAAVVLVFAAAAVASVGNELRHLGSSFLSTGLPGYGEAATGDHLQTSYWFWLVGHRLEQGATPWIDPYSFQPLVEPRVVFGGWLWGFPFWPLHAAFGHVVAWNVLLLAMFAVAGVATYAWLRAVDLPVTAALVGGLAFELAPYRLAQSGGHLLGWTAVFLPLALLGIERSRAAASRPARHIWGAVAALALVSVPLSGQVHLALGAIPFVLGYAAVRFRPVPFGWTAGGVLVAIGIGLLVSELVISGSTESGGRSLAEIQVYQASWDDFVDRTRNGGLEQFVHLGWFLPMLALAGLVVLARGRLWLAVLLGLAVAVPVLLALGTNTPVYEALRAVFPPLRYPRVPGRLMPIADLALAGLAAFAVAAILGRVRARAAVVVSVALVVVVAADLTVWPLRATAADPDNAAYSALGAGRILELPITESVFGSPYLYYVMQEPRERPGGYASARPKEQAAFNARWKRLNCGEWRLGDNAELARLGVRSILLHRGLYDFRGESNGARFTEAALDGFGWRPVATDGRITVFVRGENPGPPVRSPNVGVCNP
jgi:hypothetical protein